ncbi:MAG TPA: sulfotransferase [Rhizomicrobium sp.]
MGEVETERAARQRYETAVALHRQGRLADAEKHYLAVRQSHPHHPGVLHGLGLVWSRLHRHVEAAEVLRQAAAAAPRDAAIRCDLGRSCLALGRYDEALGCFESALAGRPGDTAILMGCAEALSVLGRHREARAAFEKVLALDPGHAGGHFGLGMLHAQSGERAAARRAFDRAVARAPRQAAYHRALADIERFEEHDSRLAALEALAADEDNLAADQRAELHFALAKAYDDLNRFDAAFDHLQKANTGRRRLVAYDEAAVAGHFRELTRSFTPAIMAAKGAAGHPSDLPVFIVGMPRSGTTLVEQMLAAHPQVFGAGELLHIGDQIAEGLAGRDYPSGMASLSADALRAFAERYCDRLKALAPGARRIVDKLPANFRHLGLIHLALPQARILHVCRDPMDTCFSCYTKLFPGGLNYTYDLGELGRYHKMYAAMMAHWRAVLPNGAMLEMQYENLVGDFEAQARRIVAFCGLDWDPACLRFHEAGRPVRTLSQAQVRQPLFTSSIGRWRRYAHRLQPLRDALE